MDYRTLGRTGVKVSPLCLGAMMFGAWGNPDHDDVDPDHPPRARRRASTSSTRPTSTRAASPRRSSRKALKGRRDEVVLATKVHGAMGEGPNERGNSRRWIIQECEASLRRLGTDWIDLYQIHRWDHGHRPRRDARRAHRPRARGQGALHRLVHVSGERDRDGAVGCRSGAAASASSASSRRTRCSCAGSRPRCCRSARGTGWGLSRGARSPAAG